jgi:hypothetical protein
MNRIAVDIDEVLMPFVKPMARWRKLSMPTKAKYSYIYSNMFNITAAESKDMVYKFYDSEVFEMIQPIEGSVEAIKKLRGQFDKMYIVTGRQEYARSATEDWVDFHFPNMFDDIILTNSYTNREVCKSDICTCLNIGTIVDDNDMTCALTERVGVKAIHFAGYDGNNVYPWCYYDKKSVLSWPEAVDRINTT